MLRLKMPKSDRTLKLRSKQDPDEFLALPGAEPVTLVRVSSKNLPFGCQCPFCGELFELPQGNLYKIEDDEYADIDSGAELSDHFVGPDSDLSDSGSPDDADFLETVQNQPAVDESEEL